MESFPQEGFPQRKETAEIVCLVDFCGFLEKRLQDHDFNSKGHSSLTYQLASEHFLFSALSFENYHLEGT